ncbi:unnamed protein product [Soboliphyme baturini]|uniref:Conserved oligomeric Golgi complex subunit 8 n=1 Tax=Soboliphyme baturini TaxID=241478 RepID=A0A183J6K1_9BILA|nr:unnamed protein product [Soboliphyme baturini]
MKLNFLGILGYVFVFNTVCDYTDSLLGCFPQLKESCRTFITEGRDLVSKIKQDNAIITSESKSTIRSILNIPKALSSCVYAGRYEDALELIQNVTELEKQLGHLQIFKEVMTEVGLQRDAILDYCLGQMESDLTVAACLKVVSFLRRLGVYSEAELRFKFLHARDVWFQSMLNAEKPTDSLASVCQMVEVHRLHLFDVVTQYRAVFPDEDPVFITMTSLTKKHANVVLSAILGSWILDKINRFLKSLIDYLNDDRVLENLDSVLSQCMYFGLSMGRIGADFRLLMVPVFENVVLRAVQSRVEIASSKYLLTVALEKHTLTHHTFRLKEKMKFSKTFIANNDYADAAAARSTAPEDPAASAAAAVSQPPSILLKYTELAVYCNEVLQALNKVRNCLPLKLACQISSILEEAFCSVLTCLNEKLENDRNYQAEDAKRDLLNFGIVFVNDFLCFINTCLEVLFPSKSLADAIGIPLSKFSQLVRH